MYLQEQLHVLAGVEANICGFRCSALQWRLQCTAGKVGVHCREGWSALQGRLECTAGKVGVHCVLDRLIKSKMHHSILGRCSPWSENLKVMYRLTDYME